MVHMGLMDLFWEDVKDCEVQHCFRYLLLIYWITLQKYISNIPQPFELPTKPEFDMIDMSGDNDGVLTLDEWARFVNCD